jgi:hypothetical protein
MASALMSAPAPARPDARVVPLDGEAARSVDAPASEPWHAGARRFAGTDRLGPASDRDRVGKADEGVSPHPYLITASVLASKKWMRSGTKTSRIFS